MAKQKFQKLSTESLAGINQGVVAAALDNKINMALLDCEDRPNDKRPRKVTLEIKFIPIPTETGASCADVDVDFSFKASVPNAQTRSYRMPVKSEVNSRGVQVVVASFAPTQTEDEPEFIDRDANPKL